jgi:pyridoxine 5-phosphate synthase
MSPMKVKLSVNINKIATLRNARGNNIPDVLQWAVDIERFGADGITVHPRPDERHITRADVHGLKKIVSTEFNIEGYPTNEFMELVKSVRPEQVTLVPDPPEALTSNAGWDVTANKGFLTDTILDLQSHGIRTSIFLDPSPQQAEAAALVAPDRIELYTEAYAKGYTQDRASAVRPFIETAQVAMDAGLGINAGHDLNLENLAYFAACIPGLLEVSIGHALISDALTYGMENTVRMYQRCLEIKS